MSLQGSEVGVAARGAKAVMSDAYATVKNGECFLINMQITPYPWGQHLEPRGQARPQAAPAQKGDRQASKSASAQQGYTLLPLEVYLKQGKIKVLLGVCKGKKQYVKRQDQKRKDAAREVEAALRRRDR